MINKKEIEEIKEIKEIEEIEENFKNKLFEHRFCVKIIRYYLFNTEPSCKLKNGLNVGNNNDKGPINNIQFERIINYIRSDIFESSSVYEDNQDSENNLKEIEIQFITFFKFVMVLTYDNFFKLKEDIFSKQNDIYELCNVFLPDYDIKINNLPYNSFYKQWELIKRQSDEFEISQLLNNEIVKRIYKNSNIYEIKEKVLDLELLIDSKKDKE